MQTTLELTTERLSRSCIRLREETQDYADESGQTIYFTHEGKVFDVFAPRGYVGIGPVNK